MGRSMWPIFVQFRCPHSGTTFCLHEYIDFYVLNTNSLVVTSRNPQFFCNLRSKYWFFYLNYVWKLHVIYSFCTSPSLLAGSFMQLRAFLYCFDHCVYRIVNWNHTICMKKLTKRLTSWFILISFRYVVYLCERIVEICPAFCYAYNALYISYLILYILNAFYIAVYFNFY